MKAEYHKSSIQLEFSLKEKENHLIKIAKVTKEEDLLHRISQGIVSNRHCKGQGMCARNNPHGSTNTCEVIERMSASWL